MNEQLNVIKKYNTAFKLNNYMNIWTQWYMMWSGDLRGQTMASSIFLVPNSTANFAISEETRSYFRPDPSNPAGPAKEVKENFINIDHSSIKTIVNMAGLYSAYLIISLLLAAGTIYVVIRKDFV